MKPMTTAFEIKFDSVADPEALVLAENVRFTVLTERLLRLEYSPNGSFEDRPSQTFWVRRLAVPQFDVRRTKNRIEIETRYLLLEHADGRGFSESSLRITLKENGI